MPRTFLLAPMDRVMWLLTGFFLLLGPFFMALSVISFRPLGLPGLLVVVLGALVYLVWRPTAFVLEGGALTLAFPVRTRRYPLDGLTSVQRIDNAAFRARFGWALRVGVGGLFGGFGWLWTPKGWVEMDISRIDAMVLMEWQGRSPLLVTPATPDDFVAAVKAEAGLG